MNHDVKYEELDYLVVGLGIAGLCLCEQFEMNNKSFVVIDSKDTSATQVAGGVYNPVVLKRFTIAWQGTAFLKYALSFYNEIAAKLNTKFLHEMPALRIFSSVEEQNDWVVASDKKELSHYLVSQISSNTNSAIHAPFGFGEVSGTGLVNTSVLLSAYKNKLRENKNFEENSFEYDNFKIEADGIRYKNYSAKKIIFAEGAAVLKNPYFPKERIIGNKGEYIIIHAPELQLNAILKGYIFIIPMGNDLYKIGATYDIQFKTLEITNTARELLIKQLSKIIRCPYIIINQESGIRPTTKDRKPLLGAFGNNKNLVFFNGLGARGISMAPLLSKYLYDYLEDGTSLPDEIKIDRPNL